MRDSILASHYIQKFKELTTTHNLRMKINRRKRTAFMRHNPRNEPLLMYHFQKDYITLDVKKAMILCVCNKKGRIQKEVKRTSMEGKTVMDLDLVPELKDFLGIQIDEDKELGERC
jgi:hypothetical protein